MSLKAIPPCTFCESRNDLSLCSYCRVVSYCCRQHLLSHYKQHKSQCYAIKRSRTLLEQEEQKLRAIQHSNPFQTEVGVFWTNHETRAYMCARFAYVDYLMRIKTVHAVQTALDHSEDMLRLCRGDNVGIRTSMPAMYLRLGRDQKCYDFVKWYCTVSCGYDWGDVSLPYLNITNADVFEPCHGFIHKAELSHAIAIALVKIKLLLDVRVTSVTAALLLDKIPQEIVDNIYGRLLSPLTAPNVARLGRSMHDGTMVEIIKDLHSQVEEIYHTVHRKNKHFWPALLAPGKNLTADPDDIVEGSEAEMQVILQQNYDAWMETPVAIEVIRTIMYNN